MSRSLRPHVLRTLVSRALSIAGGLAALILSASAGVASAQTPECPGYDPDLGIVWGVVRAMEGGAPVPGAAVEVRWSGGQTEAQSLRNGIYIVCGVRTDIPVVV